MGPEWVRLGSSAHMHLCLLLPLPVLDYLLPPSLLALTWTLLLPSVHRCAQVPAHSYEEGLSWTMHPQHLGPFWY